MESLLKLLDPGGSETLLSGGAALWDFLPEGGEDAETLRHKAEEAVREGRSLGRVAEGVIRFEPLVRFRAEEARRTAVPEDVAVDGWRVTLSLTLAGCPLPSRVLPGLRAERKSPSARLWTPAGGAPGIRAVTWIGERSGGFISVSLPEAAAAGPVTIETRREGAVRCVFTSAGGFRVGWHDWKTE